MSSIKVKINKHLKKFHITEEHIEYCNRCDTLHLISWYDHKLLKKQENHVVLKDKPHCYIIREGIFNSETCELAPPFIALQKYLELTILQAYHVCNDFLQTVNIAAIRKYCNQMYGAYDFPTVPVDALNYILDQNILKTDPSALPSLFEILTQTFCIDREVIIKLIDQDYITMDSNYNICFNSFDENNNVISVYKMSRYKHSNSRFSYNHYVTQRDVGFVYLSEIAEKQDSIDAVTVFDNPIELLSYLTLEKTNPITVPNLSMSNYFISMFHGNTAIVQKWLDSNEVDSINVAVKLGRQNQKYIKTRFYYYAKLLNIPYIHEPRRLLTEYFATLCKEIEKRGCVEGKKCSECENTKQCSFKFQGWNDLLKCIIHKRPVELSPIPEDDFNKIIKKQDYEDTKEDEDTNQDG